MSDNSVSDLVTPADEILGRDGEITTEDLLDEVSLYNLYDDRDSPEQNAERILGITYPTNTLTTIIENTVDKLGEGSTSEGSHVIGGEYGSGKSHIELVLYHLLSSPDVGQEWLDDEGVDVNLPTNARAAALQMLNLDQEYDKLSVAVGDYLGIDEWSSGGLPAVHDIRDALDGQPTAIFVDEFERWFGMSGRSGYQSDNLAFLQNLLEAAGRDDTPLAVFVSLLYEDSDVEAIVQRTNPFTYDLSARRDEKIRFLLHRLIGDRDDPAAIAALAKEYTDVYRQNDQIQLTDYHEMEGRIDRYYPFHPVTLDLLMDKYSEQSGHQDARGLLRLLTEILADNFERTDLVLTGDIDVFEYSGWFRFIDGGLVGKYLSDYHRLGTPINPDEENGEKEFADHVEELLDIVLLHSLARDGEEGANKRQMLMGTIRKGKNAHEIVQTFQEDVYGHAWHIFRINGEYAFDTDENPAARIEKRSEDIHKHDAIHRIERLVTDDLFDGHNNVFVLDPVNTEQNVPDNKNLKIVVSLAAKRRYDDDFEALTTGQEREFNNTLVLVTPEKRSSVDSNTGIIELARKVVAGEQLDREEQTLPEGFEDIRDQHYQNLRDRVRDKYGTVHTSTDRGLFPEELPTSEDADFYSATIEVVRPDSSQLRNEVEEAVEANEGGGIQYQHLLNDFYRNPKYTTLVEEAELRDAIDSLCRGGVIEVGNYFEEPFGSLGSDTVLVHSEFRASVSEDDEPATITIDKAESSMAVDDGETGESGVRGADASSQAVEAFLCPQCGSNLEGTSCDCGFEFSAEDFEEGSVTVEGGTVDDLLGQFEELQEEVDEVEDLGGSQTTRFPMMQTLDADDKPTLIDDLEREIGYDWEIHKIHLDITGTLDEADLANRGLGDGLLAERVTVDESLDIELEEPVSRTELLNNILVQLDVPDDASFGIWFEVDKNE